METRLVKHTAFIFALALIFLGAVIFDSAWAQTGTITGRVTNTGGTAGLGNVRIYVYDAYGAPTTTPTTFVATNSNGDYTLTLSPGNYKLNFYPLTGAGFYVAEWYNDTYLSAEAQMITLSAGQNLPNISASLASGGRIAGKVTGPSGDLSNITIRAWNTDLSPAFSGRTDTNGDYNIPVPAGTYRLQFDPTTPSPGQNFLIEFYNDKKDMKTADIVTVTAGLTVTRNAQLAVPQPLTISGCIRDGSAAPISGVVINGLVNSPVTGVDGCYTGTVNYGWGCYSGRIIPLKGDTIFIPSYKDYPCVSGNQVNQDYTGTMPSSTVYYDQFTNPTIDPQKWENNQFVREIVGGRLVTKTTAYESTVQNRLYFKNPDLITYFEADVAVNEVDGNYGPVGLNIEAHPQAGLLGVYYNAATGTPGSLVDDVSAQVRLRFTQGQLNSEWRVIKYTVDDGSVWTILGENTLSSALTLGAFYKLSINWNQATKTFTFSDGVATPQSHTVTDTINPPQNVTRFLRSGVLIVQDETQFVTEPSLWGRVSAAFDNAVAKDVITNPTPLITDDFSSTPLNANKWDSQEFVREIRSGELFSQTRGVNSTESVSNSLSLKNPENVNEIQAKVTLSSYQNLNRASAQARLLGYFYNDAGDPNSGYQGETYAFVEILSGSSTDSTPYAQWLVLRFNDPNAAMWKWTVHQSGTFPVTISTGGSHILGLKWDGARFSFKFDDYVAYYTPFTPIFPSNIKAKQLRTQIMPAAASVPPYDAFISATFDDVRIGIMNLLYLPLILKN